MNLRTGEKLFSIRALGGIQMERSNNTGGQIFDEIMGEEDGI